MCPRELPERSLHAALDPSSFPSYPGEALCGSSPVADKQWAVVPHALHGRNLRHTRTCALHSPLCGRAADAFDRRGAKHHATRQSGGALEKSERRDRNERGALVLSSLAQRMGATRVCTATAASLAQARRREPRSPRLSLPLFPLSPFFLFLLPTPNSGKTPQGHFTSSTHPTLPTRRQPSVLTPLPALARPFNSFLSHTQTHTCIHAVLQACLTSLTDTLAPQAPLPLTHERVFTKFSTAFSSHPQSDSRRPRVAPPLLQPPLSHYQSVWRVRACACVCV